MGLLAASPAAEAGNILRMGGSSGAAPTAAASGGVGTLTPASSPGTLAAHNLLSRTAQALASVQAMQTMARTAAQNLTTNYLVTHAGNILLVVPDGLTDNRPAGGAGGLIPDNGIVPDPNNPGSYILSGTWTGVAGLSQQPSTGGQTTVTVTQSAQQALLNWQTFNVGQHTTLNFDQSAGGADVGKWIAFNKINSTGVPSQILGSIQAQGQVYVINPNGIIFGGSSQVNAHALVASSLPINDNLVQLGLLNNPDGQFLFSALPIPVLAGGNGTPAFNPPTITGTYGDVEIQPGAQLSAPTTPEHIGGLVALVGPNVYNGGTINTPDGQTILAAGLQVGLAAHNTNDPTLRGLDVYVGAVADNATTDPNFNNPNHIVVQTASGTAGTSENADPQGAVTTGGDIEALRADVTITGQNVNQFGIINSSTSVAYNGRVDLLANYNAISNGLTPDTSNNIPLFLYQSTGTVTLGPGSVTQILPELASTDRVVGTALSLPSLINIQGQTIHLQSDAAGDPDTGAIILAPSAGIMPTLAELNVTQPNRGLPEDNNYTTLGAGVSLTAGTWALENVDIPPDQPPTVGISAKANLIAVTSPANTPAVNLSQITLDQGATIDVSGSQGTDFSASVAENIVPVQLQGAQLANSPLQRDGPFYHQTINIDILQTGIYNGQEWVGTPLADTTGYVNLIQRSVGELTTNGGTVALNAGDAVSFGQDSSVNVSGGWIHYQGGVVSTTKVLSGGHVMDISQATPDLVYDGIYTGTFTTSDAKWGITQTYTNPLLGAGGQYEQAYDQGGSAGSIYIAAPSIKTGGNLYGNSAAGTYQRTPDAQVQANFKGTTVIPTMESVLSVPATGSLSLFFQGETATGVDATPSYPTYVNPPDIYVQQSPGNQTPGNPQPLTTDVVLAPNLVSQEGDGFGNLTVFDPNGNINLLENITTPAGGSLIFTGQNITVGNSVGNQVNVNAPSGTLSFTVDGVSPFAGNSAAAPLNVPDGFGQFTLGAGASLSTAGLIVDDRTTAAAPGTLPLFTNGGTITINAYRIDLSNGQSIDVSGGVQMTAAGKPTYGAGGKLTINATEPTASDSGLLPDTGSQPYFGQLLMGATLKGYSGKTGSGGTLNITAPFVQIGGDLTQPNPLLPDYKNPLINGDDPSVNLGRTLLLQPEFFNQGGFSNFTLAGLGDYALDASGEVIPFTYMPGFVVAPDTIITPQVSSYMATTPADGGLMLTPTLLPFAGQRTPANLTFSSIGQNQNLLPAADFTTGVPNNEGLRGDLVIYPGAVIQTDPLGSVTLNKDQSTDNSTTYTDNTVTMLGSIYAFGGNISIMGALQGDETTIPVFAATGVPTVDLGPNSVLDASGTTVLTPDTSGHNLHTGNVVSGGSISISGNIVVEGPVFNSDGTIKVPGATIKVNGASDQIYLPQAYTEANTAQSGNISGSKIVPVREDSNGGSISLAGQDELFTGANLQGFAGGSTLPGGSMAQGGSLTISSSFFGASTALPTQPSLFLTPNGTPFYVAGQTVTVNEQPVTVAGTSQIVSGLASGGPIVVGNPVVGTDGTTPLGAGHFAASSFNNGGFASLTVGAIAKDGSGANGTVQFSGDVSLRASNSLTIGNTGILLADPTPGVTLADLSITTSSLTLKAPYVVLGQPFLAPVLSSNATGPFSFKNKPTTVSPTYGSGSLIVNASDLIDIGNLSLQNIGVANFDATKGGTTNGAIRGDGTLDVAGAITMTAGQIYPPTATTFNIAAYSNAVPNFNILVANSSATSPTQVGLDPSYSSNPLPPGFGIGSSLLGSVVTDINGLNVTLASAANNTGITSSTSESYTNNSSVKILPGLGIPAVPLSAGGTLSIYAPLINQGGVLRAPIGTINLGASSSTATDPLSGQNFPTTSNLTLLPGSWTSVSAAGLTIPYGINLNGISWIDPTGQDITVQGNGAVGVGLPAKSVNISAANVNDEGAANGQPAAIIDLSGGGDLYAYRWIPGLGGSYDILNASYDVSDGLYDIGASGAPKVSTSFAVIPGYQPDYAPFAEYNTTNSNFSITNPNPNVPSETNIVDSGYTSTGLSVGQQVYLGASNGLSAGTYTLLPARYALLPGAFLVTPKSGTPTGTVSRPDGSSLVSGYKFNDLNPTAPTLLSSFEVDPQSVVTSRAEYAPSSANSFLSQSAQAQKLAIPRLPVDAGQLVFTATQALNIAGSLAAQTPAGGRGSLVDISSGSDILIASPDGITREQAQGFSGLTLDSNTLSLFGADSLLIGGVRTTTTSGTMVNVMASEVIVDNAGEANADGTFTAGDTANGGETLNGPDVILVANQNLNLAPGADVEQGTRTLSSPAEALQVGQTFIFDANNNNPTLTDNPTLTVARSGVAISFPKGISTNDSLAVSGTDGIITPAGGGTPTNFSAGSSITPTAGSTVTLNGSGALTISGPDQVPVTIGDGTLLRVSSDPSAAIARSGVTGANPPSMTIGAGAQIGNASPVGSVTLDSTGLTLLNSTGLSAHTINLDSGQISIQLPNHPGSLWPTNGQTTTGLVLSSDLFNSLESSASSLSLLSYSSIDIYGSNEGTVASSIANLSLDAGEICGFNTGGGTAAFSAQNILLDNSANGIVPVRTLPSNNGALEFDATNIITLGTNQLAIDQYNTVNLNADGGILVQGTGGLTTQGSLAMTTPLVTGATGASQTIRAGGSLSVLGITNPDGSLVSAPTEIVTSPGGSPVTVADQLGANLTLVGTTNDVTINSNITLRSGTLKVEAMNGNLLVGNASTSLLDVSGTAKAFFGATQYTSGGQVTLTSDTGNVNLGTGSTVNVSAQPAAGNAGSLTISASNTNGTFIANGALYGQGGTGGQGGTFSLDVGTLSNLASLEAILNPIFDQSVSNTVLGGFTQSQVIRIRTGDVVADGTAAAQTFNLSADQGNITVTGKIVSTAAQNGTIDVNTDSTNNLVNPGPTGGAINLAASGNVALSSGSLLTVAGQNFNDAGKGGAVSLAAGCYEVVNGVGSVNPNATVTIAPTSTIDLSVVKNVASGLAQNLNAGGTLPLGNNLVNVGGNEYITVTNTGAATGTPIGTIYCPVNNHPGTYTTTPLYANDLTVVNGASYITLNSGVSGTVNFPGSTAAGDYTGTLLLSESQPAFGNGTALINSLGSNIENASNIVLAGLHVFDLSGASSTNPAITSISSNGTINLAVENAVMNNGRSFVSPVYTSNQGFFQNNPNVNINIEPSAEIVNENTNTSAGALTLASTWDLSKFRFGPNVNGGAPNGDGSGEPGILTLRAAGNLVFKYNANTSASLTDGFDTANSAQGALNTTYPVWTAQLMPVPTNGQAETLSWSYNLVAGADFGAADLQQVVAGAGSLLLGFNNPANPASPALQPATGTFSDLTTIKKYYQVIRTGTGDINIFSGQDVQFLNPLATIYTAGSQAPALASDEFDVPNPSYLNIAGVIVAPNSTSSSQPNAAFFYPAQYEQNGGNVTISAQNDIIQYTVNSANALVPNSSQEMPTNWLYRRGYVNPTGQFAMTHTSPNLGRGNVTTGNTEVDSTTWWTDFSNFFEGVGALGGGNVTLLAGQDVSNVDAVAPTNARVTKQLPNSAGTFFTNLSDSTTGTYDQVAADQTLLELGGGDVTINAGNNINGGVYYVERGSGALSAGNTIQTNSTRTTVTGANSINPITWLPTTLFLGQGSFDVTAGGNVLLGPVANPFLLPQGINNSYFDKTYFSTYATTDAVDVSSLTGNVTLQDDPDSTNTSGTLINWYNTVLEQSARGAANQQPWLSSVETSLSSYFTTAAALMPGTLQATAFSGDLNLVGSLTLSPSPTGTVDLAAAGSINGFQPSSLEAKTLPSGASVELLALNSTTIDLSDASPNSLPGIDTPLSLTAAAIAATSLNPITQNLPAAGNQDSYWDVPPSQNTKVPNGPTSLLPNFATIFAESGSFTGSNGVLQTQQTLHGTSVIAGTDVLGPLHVNDTTGPIQLYAQNGDISGITLFSGKAAQVVAGNDITDIALYLQNNNPNDVSMVDAGRDIIAYDPISSLRSEETQIPGNEPLSDAAAPLAGDIQISGPGTLEVLTGRNLNLGIGPNNSDGTAVGITSIGNARNPVLPFAGADVVAGAGIGVSTGVGLDGSQLDFTAFIDQFLTPTSSYWQNLLPNLQALLPGVNFGAGLPAVWQELDKPDNELSMQERDEKQLLASQILGTYYLVLRDAGRDFNNPSSPSYKKNYNNGFAAIADLFPAGKAWQGDISLTSRDIKTENGGNISIFAPGGQLTVGLPVGKLAADQGILTQHGGDISIFTNGSVNVGISRIFTLFGGNEIIWSSTGNIAAGSASKTVQSAPPTRVIVDPQSGNIELDLAGLATGGGIGALETVPGVPPANIDLIAPAGFVDAGDAGIRASGNLNISAVQVLNASNIQVSGKSTGTPAPPAAPNVASIASASNTTSASSNAADEVAKQGHAPVQQQEFPSIITVEVLGYGGGDS